jgi:hypothetical protein
VVDGDDIVDGKPLRCGAGIPGALAPPVPPPPILIVYVVPLTGTGNASPSTYPPAPAPPLPPCPGELWFPPPPPPPTRRYSTVFPYAPLFCVATKEPDDVKICAL